MRYLGILRGSRYSVNMADLDSAIFREVVLRLSAKGIAVDCIPETEMSQVPLQLYDAVLLMARDVDALRKFHTSLPCYNSVEGILACSCKERVAEVFSEAGIPQPRYTVARPGQLTADFFPLWVKRGNGCTEQKADTVYVSNPAELRSAIGVLASKGVDTCLLQAHVEGDLVKFYGVEGTDFFHWSYADPAHSKFGLEALNGSVRGYAFSSHELKALADRAAAILGVQIYGGDCIVDAGGAFYFIDFNDWPSFYSCRLQAAEAIARRVTVQ